MKNIHLVLISLLVMGLPCLLSAEGIEYDRLSIPVKGEWIGTPAKGYSTFTRKDKPGGIVVLSAIKASPGQKEAFLTRIMTAHSENRTVVKVLPEKIAVGKTKSGLVFASQASVTKSTKDTWYCQYFTFELSDGLQAAVVFADTPEVFKELAPLASAGIEQANARAQSTATAVPTAVTANPSAPTSVHQQTGPMSDQFITGVVTAQSAELKPVSFKVLGGTAFDGDDMVITDRDKTGGIYMMRNTMSSPYVGWDIAQFLHRQQNWSKPARTTISREFLMKTVAQLGKEKVDMFFVSNSTVNGLGVDPEGNVFIAIQIEDHNAFLQKSTNGDVRLIASPSQLRKIANGYQTHGSASYLKPTNKGNAWLFIQGVDSNGKNYGTVAYLLAKTANGFASKEVAPTYQGKPIDRVAAYGIYSRSVVDQDENLVYYNNGSFWRMRPTGEITEIVRLTLPTKDVTVSGPVVLENGDIWLAFSTEYSVSSYANVNQGYVDIRNTWFMVGDRSRLVRIRIKGNAVELGEISSDKILAALRQAKLPLRKDSTVMRTSILRKDYQSGGLILYDGHHNTLYGILPE